MRVNHGLTPQDLKAYGINDVQDIVHNPSYDMLFQEELDPSLEGYEPVWVLSPSTRAFLPVVLRKISISFATTPPAIPSGGPIKAKVKTTTSRFHRKPGSI